MAATPHPDQYRMSFGEHLEELRGRMIRALVGVFVACIATFYFGKDIIAWLTEPLSRALLAVGLPPHTISSTPMSPFFLYMKVSLIAAVIVSGPWILYQTWKFVSAGLYAHERKVAYILAPFSTGMTVLAVLFMYYVMLPVTLAFLMFFAVSFGPAGGQTKDPLDFLSKFVSGQPAAPAPTSEGNPSPETTPEPAIAPPATSSVPQLEADPINPNPGQMWVNTSENALKVRVGDKVLVAYLAVSSLVSPLIDLAQYIDFVLFMTLGIALAFQMPVAMLVVGWTGILTAAMLAGYRKHMFFVCFCLGAIITPSSDPLSMTLMAMPLYLLFELGLLLMRMTQREMEDEEEDDDDEDDEDDDEDEEDDEEKVATAT